MPAEAWLIRDTAERIMAGATLADVCRPLLSLNDHTRLLAVMDSRLRRYGRGSRPVKQVTNLLSGAILACDTCERPMVAFGNSHRCRRWHESKEALVKR